MDNSSWIVGKITVPTIMMSSNQYKKLVKIQLQAASILYLKKNQMHPQVALTFWTVWKCFLQRGSESLVHTVPGVRGFLSKCHMMGCQIKQTSIRGAHRFREYTFLFWCLHKTSRPGHHSKNDFVPLFFQHGDQLWIAHSYGRYCIYCHNFISTPRQKREGTAVRMQLV